MDLSKLVVYDQSFPVSIKHPVTGADIGITINIVSNDSERVARVGSHVNSKRWEAVFSSEDKKLSVESAVGFMEQEQRERLIAAIDSWDFGGHSWGDLPENPECNDKNKRYLVEHPNAVALREQLAEAANNLSNFSQDPPQPSAKPSTTK